MWFKIIMALLLVWPRGYLLIYLIDRTKSFSFGFKFFVGWLLGLAGFTLDIFAALVFGGQTLNWPVLLLSATSQIVGFGFMIFLFEKKIPLPHLGALKPFVLNQINIIRSFSGIEKTVLLLLVLTLLLRVGASVWQTALIPTYDFDAWNNWNLRAKVIYTESVIPLDPANPFYLGGGIKSYPLNDALLKVWLAKAAGNFDEGVINSVSVIYYCLLLAIFYVALGSVVPRLVRLVATYALSGVPLLYFHSQVAYADLYYSIFLFVSLLSLFYFLSNNGLSFFYLSGIMAAFAIWTKNEGLTILLPVLLLISMGLWFSKKVKTKDFLLHWFFAALTIFPWLAFRIINRLDILSGDSSSFKLVYNGQFVTEVMSSIFLRSHFNLLFVLFFVLMLLKIKDVYRDQALRFLFAVITTLFLIYNGIIIFTDKAYDLSAATRVNLHLVPLIVAALAFYYHKFFGRIKL
ncbi:MAG: glycosyltransferase family 39 protein [Candidatus Buchananbacteria bacterium]|nr:glycosyltransferase family 39 protein [Candidatus Buchananbacteria bacterium]